MADWKLTEEGLYYTSWRESKQFVFVPGDQKPGERYDLSYRPLWIYEGADEFIVVDDLNHPMSVFNSVDGLRPVKTKGIDQFSPQQQHPRYFTVYKTSDDLVSTTYRIYDWTQHKVGSLQSPRPFYVVDEKALTVVDNTLSCYDVDGKLLWQYRPGPGDIDLEGETVDQFSKGDYPAILGIYRDELWIQANNSTFVVLNASTGKPIFANFRLESEIGETVSTGDSFLDQQSGKIKILAYSKYVEIDLATHRAEIKKIFGGDWVLRFGQFYTGDPRVYFTGNNIPFPNRKSIGDLVVGIFNTETLEIEWHYSLPDDDKFYFFQKRPQANKKYIGIKDSKFALHIFERQ